MGATEQMIRRYTRSTLKKKPRMLNIELEIVPLQILAKSWNSYFLLQFTSSGHTHLRGNALMITSTITVVLFSTVVWWMSVLICDPWGVEPIFCLFFIAAEKITDLQIASPSIWWTFRVPGFRLNDQAAHKAVTATPKADSQHGILRPAGQLDVLWPVYPEIGHFATPGASPNLRWWSCGSGGCPPEQSPGSPDNPSSYGPLLLAFVWWFLHAPCFRGPGFCPLRSRLPDRTVCQSGGVSNKQQTRTLGTPRGDFTARSSARKDARALYPVTLAARINNFDGCECEWASLASPVDSCPSFGFPSISRGSFAVT